MSRRLRRKPALAVDYGQHVELREAHRDAAQSLRPALEADEHFLAQRYSTAPPTYMNSSPMHAAELPHLDRVAVDTGEVLDDLERRDRVDPVRPAVPARRSLRDDAPVDDAFGERDELRVRAENDRRCPDRLGNGAEARQKRESRSDAEHLMGAYPANRAPRGIDGRQAPSQPSSTIQWFAGMTRIWTCDYRTESVRRLGRDRDWPQHLCGEGYSKRIRRAR